MASRVGLVSAASGPGSTGAASTDSSSAGAASTDTDTGSGSAGSVGAHSVGAHSVGAHSAGVGSAGAGSAGAGSAGADSAGTGSAGAGSAGSPTLRLHRDRRRVRRDFGRHRLGQCIVVERRRRDALVGWRKGRPARPRRHVGIGVVPRSLVARSYVSHARILGARAIQHRATSRDSVREISSDSERPRITFGIGGVLEIATAWWALRDSNPRHPRCKRGALAN